MTGKSAGHSLTRWKGVNPQATVVQKPQQRRDVSEITNVGSSQEHRKVPAVKMQAQTVSAPVRPGRLVFVIVVEGHCATVSVEHLGLDLIVDTVPGGMRCLVY